MNKKKKFELMLVYTSFYFIVFFIFEKTLTSFFFFYIFFLYLLFYLLSCAREMKLMKTELERLKNRGQSTEKSDEEKRLDQIESMYDTIMTKYGKVRGILARKNQTISTVAREIDDVPTRTELIQYERRFQELYQEIESTLEETRKYFDKYNIQVRIKSYLQKEVEVLGK